MFRHLKIHQNLTKVMMGINDISLDLKRFLEVPRIKIENGYFELSSNVVEDLEYYYDLLIESHELYKEINKTNKTNEIVSAIKQSYETLEKLIKNPNSLPKNINKLSTDSNSITAKMGLAIPLIMQSPLSIDKIYVHGDVKLPKANGNFFESLWLGIQRFFLTF